VVPFVAPAEGQLEVSAQAVAVVPADLVEAASATQTVEVLAAGTVALTLEAPLNVTVGATFTVTVGVSAGTQLMEGATVIATISFPAGTADSAEQEVELTPDLSLDTRIFMAPVTAGDFTVAVSGSTDDASIDEVRSASAQVSVEAVALVLVLGGPDEVTVGETYQVMVQTDEAVPAGTTLEVTVSAGPDMREVLLTAAIPSTEVSFTAPASAGQVMVTAMATPDTAAGALEVAVSNAQPLTVTVSVREVELVLQLLEVPAEVVARDDFAVRVLSVPAVPEGATLAVTVVFDGTTSAAMTLLPGIARQ